MPTGFDLQNNQYTGNPTDTVILPAVASSITVKSDLCRLHTVNGIKVILKGDAQTKIQDSTANFSPQGTIIQNFSDVTLQPVPFSLQLEIAKIDFYNTYTANYLTGGLVKFGGLDPLTRQILYDQITAKNASNLEELAWNGKLFDPSDYIATSSLTGWVGLAMANAPASNRIKISTSGRYAATAISATGVLTMASTTNLNTGDVLTITSVASAVTVNGATIVGQSFKIEVLSTTTVQLYPFDGGDVIAVTGSGTLAIGFQCINAYSVFDNFATAIRVLPRKTKTAQTPKGRVVIAVPVHVADSYYERLIANGNAQVNYLNQDPLTFSQNTNQVSFTKWGNYDVAIVPGLQANTIIAYNTDNFHYATNALTDSSSLLFVDMAQSTAEQKFRVRLDFGLDVKIGYANEIALVYPKA
jgi:hypothetical protein